MKIEKNIELIDRNNRKTKYEWMGKMEVGDSVFLEGKKCTCKENSAFKMYCARRGWKRAARQIDNGLRIWRVK
jgi:tartrate dehydratase beta subunit/fumarate hydratase class I family protein